MGRSILAIVLILGVYTTWASAYCVRNETLPFRLPTSIIPSKYYLALSPNLDTNTFDGTITITATVNAQTSCVILHALGLEVSNVVATNGGGSLIATQISSEPEKQWVVADFGSDLAVGASYLIKVTFSGNINGKNATGFFSSGTTLNFGPMLSNQAKMSDQEIFEEKTRQRDMLGKTLIDPVFDNFFRQQGLREKRQSHPARAKTEKQMYATQFEPTYARMAFPCFDEPGFKAYWQAEFTIPSNRSLTVLFNSMETGVTANKDGTETWFFKQTQHPMANYLVAYAIGELEYIEQNHAGTRYRIYTPIGGSKYGKFSLNVTINVLDYFGKLWDFPYMLEKLDQIAVPAIVQDAMENWGLCTYDPAFLLVDPNHNDLVELQLVASVVVHELSHQWMGDTVTMPWWSETYLNEGFARYLQYVGVQYLFPEWHVLTADSSMINIYGFAYNPALKQDTTASYGPSIAPQSQVSGNATSAKDSFGYLSYSKGGSLNYYFNRILGDDIWNRALGIQVNKHAYTNPTYVDLVNSLNAAVGDDSMQELLEMWLTQAGYPIIDVHYDEDDMALMLVQSPATTYHVSPNTLWWINTNISLTNLMTGKQQVLNADFVSKIFPVNLPAMLDAYTAVDVNFNFTGFFLVDYKGRFLNEMVARKYASSLVTSIQRAQYINNLFSVIRLRPDSLSGALYFTSLMTKITNDTASWNSLLTSWLNLHHINERVGSHLRVVLADMVTKVGFTGPDPSGGLRSQLMFANAVFGSMDVIYACQDIISDFVNLGKPIPSDMQLACYFSASRYGGDNGFNFVMKQFNSATDSAFKFMLLNALVVAPSHSRCSSMFSLPNYSLLAQFSFAGYMISFNPECRGVAWQFIAANSAALIAQKATNERLVLSLFDQVFNTHEELRTVREFVDENAKLFGYGHMIDSLAWIDINIRFRELSEVQLK